MITCENNDDYFFEPTLNRLLENDSLEWIFVGGKGGVGKTTTSCSLAVQLAKKRESVLIVSTDPAHNVSDAFGQKFTSQPLKVRGFDNLYAMETDPTNYKSSAYNLEDDDKKGLMSIIPELLSTFPGIDEAMGFADLMNFIQSLNFSVIVLDTAPTGHTLRLLNFPTLIDSAFEKFGDLGSQFSSMMKMFDGGANENNQLDKFRALTHSICETFRDASRTTFVCVCIPEFLSVYETERLILQLANNEIDVSYIVVNQVIFPNRLYENFMSRRKIQSKYLKQVKELYSENFHVIPVPLRPYEVRGIKAINSFGELLLQPRELPIVEDTN
uniref:ATPase ASNA1 homolog n=1 Tax=Dermatophagoides pteronyssinus TaxID=6956 RepID=A0A6P6YD94_DERPT|nr:ATPase ASNA1 homolog [Dermatophagoides pteronyssinus]